MPNYKGYEPVVPDLQNNAADAASAASKTSPTSFTETIDLPLVAFKKYQIAAAYIYEDPETKKISYSDPSPWLQTTFDIPNKTLPVTDVVLTPGVKSYGIKFTIPSASEHADIIIFESLTGSFAGEEYIVYTGTSSSITIPTSDFAPRWVKIRTRDQWEDLNKSDVIAGPVTPQNADPDTTTPPTAPTGVSVVGFLDSKDITGFKAGITASWVAKTDNNTSGYVIRWTSQNPATTQNPVWEYGQVEGKATTTFTITGLVPNTLYYWQVTAKSPYNAISWASPQSGTVGPVVDSTMPSDAWAQLKSIISIGGKTADLFKFGTGIAQEINTSTTITPSMTAGTYSGIILNKSTTNVGHNYWLNTGQFRVGSATSFLYWDGSDVYTTGKINATGGVFSGNVQVSTGTIYAGASPTSGARVRMNSDGLFAYDSNNNQVFSVASATGALDARSGYIGGWNIQGSSQTTGSISKNGTILDSSGNITLGDTTGTLASIVKLSSTDTTYRLWIGSQTASNAPFRVTKAGVLYATGAVFTSSSIDGYATTAITTGLNNRLTTVEGNYVSTTTLNSSVATKNAIFVQSTTPTATKAGDIWIHDTTGVLKTWTGSTWTQRTDTTYATKVALDTKLEAGGYAIATANNQITEITSNGIVITPGTFKINTSQGTTPSTGAYVVLNSAGLTAYNGSKTTFAITASNGNAAFSGNIDSSSITGGTIVIGSDEGSTGYINTSASKGGITTMVIKAIGHASTSNSGWTTSCYPWSDATYSLGTASFSWNNLYLSSNAYFADGTTYFINSSADAYLNGYGVSGGYGITSDWSPRTDNSRSLGISSRRWADVWAVDTTVNSSDERLKKDIDSSDLGLEFIKLLRPVSYKWKETGFEEVMEESIKEIDIEGDQKEQITVLVPKVIGVDENGKDIVETVSRPGLRKHYGFVAQEVKQVLDTIGVGDSFAGWVLDDHNDPDSRQNLRYAEFISPLVRSVQELSDMVEYLQQEINTLKGV